MPYTYNYPHAAITADAVLLSQHQDTYQVLLIQRRHEPCKDMWAFPGGFMNIDETIEQCVARELQEETGLEPTTLQQLGVFSAVDRDPRERVLTVAFYALVPPMSPTAGDDARLAQWFPITQLPPLAFDHGHILTQALQRIHRPIPPQQITPEHITALRSNEVFVFGSNLSGAHYGGAALMAAKHFGAIMGQGEGLQGQSYAIPTMQGSVATIEPHVNRFIAFAQQHPELHFLVTAIGCGIAGYSPYHIATLFLPAKNLPNVALPQSFWQYIR